MQKKLLALAVAAAISAPAFADVNVVTNDGETLSVYGVLDAAYGSIRNSQSASPNFPFSVNPYSAQAVNSTANTVSGLFNGGISDSRVGLKGSEDLGDGMKAFFDVETGFDVTSGMSNNGVASLANGTNEVGANTSLNGQFFNRQAYVGISDESLGSIQGGLNYNQVADVLSKYDPVQYADLFSPLGFSGTVGGGGGISENTRVSNSLKYMNKFGAINFSLLFKPTDAANSSAGGGAVNLGYDDGAFGIQAVYESFADVLKTGSSAAGIDTGACTLTTGNCTSVNNTGIGTISATNYNTSAYLVAAKYKMDALTVKAGYEHQVLKASTDTAATSQMLYGYVAAVSSYTGNDLPTNVYYVGGDYSFTPTTNLAAGYYTINQVEADKTATGVAGQLAGTSKYISLLLDHNFSKRTDVYAGMMYSGFSGDNFDKTVTTSTAGNNSGKGGSLVYNSNVISAVGLRVKF